MPIVKFIPPVFDVKDYRSPEGNYYVAICDNCGAEFYPKRSDAKYCSKKCTIVSWRKDKINRPEEPKEEKRNIVTLISRESVLAYLKSNQIATHGILLTLKNQNIGTDIMWKGIRIKKVTDRKYEVG